MFVVFYVLIVLCLIMLFFILVACLSANSISVNPSDSTEDLVLDQAGLLLVHPVIEELGDRGRRHAVATDDLLVVPDELLAKLEAQSTLQVGHPDHVTRQHRVEANLTQNYQVRLHATHRHLLQVTLRLVVSQVVQLRREVVGIGCSTSC